MGLDLVDVPKTPYSYSASQKATLADLAARVKELRKLGSLSPAVLGKIRRFFKIKNIYHSNAIEGNQLNLGETRLVVQEGLTITGKPLKDQAEAKNLSDAVDFLEELAGDPNKPIREADIRQIHFIVLKNINDTEAGRYRTTQVEISGSQFKPPSPESVPAEMKTFSDWLAGCCFKEEPEDSAAGLLRAVVAHAWLVYIHPFVDGNGRVARLLMNLLLMRHGYPVAIITKDDRLRYYDALEESQSTDISSFVALVTECVHESLEEYERAAQQQRADEEWVQSLAGRFSERERVRCHNEYELWKNAMDLLRSYFRQTAEALDAGATIGSVYFKDFGPLEFEKYLSLREGESVKRTWFFRVDFRSGDKAARYLFFFGFPTNLMRAESATVTLHLSREEPSGAYHYERLEHISAPNVPQLIEIGYNPPVEQYVVRERSGSIRRTKIEPLGKSFFEQVVSAHFSS